MPLLKRSSLGSTVFAGLVVVVVVFLDVASAAAVVAATFLPYDRSL